LLYLATTLAFKPPTEGFPWDDLHKIFRGDGQCTKWRRNIAENFNRLSRAHERYRQQTDDRQTTHGWATGYSERERRSAHGTWHFI